jgi:trk system potassium uptake protein TrkA
MQILVMGCGRVGAMIVTSLAKDAHTIYILDPVAEKFHRIPEELLIKGLVIPIVGDGIEPDHLRKAKIDTADVFIAASGKDTPNAFAAQIAKHIFQVSKVVCRLTDVRAQKMYSQLGLIAISPSNFISDMLLEAIHR